MAFIEDLYYLLNGVMQIYTFFHFNYRNTNFYKEMIIFANIRQKHHSLTTVFFLLSKIKKIRFSQIWNLHPIIESPPEVIVSKSVLHIVWKLEHVLIQAF